MRGSAACAHYGHFRQPARYGRSATKGRPRCSNFVHAPPGWVTLSTQLRDRPRLATQAVTIDNPEWTLDQIAGLVFAGFMLASYFGASVIDQYVAAAQRKQLGLCTKCGGLYEGDGVVCEEEACPRRR
eukprot:TRINITY_DN11440_c0_g1_i1.p2 TRINITY_DN11440_c0_g1~~TRINITY_DN11440_c0_g1_i1.p2  ORF type:complete len:128 (+),score=8.24 TRINITY_DN11440_c0_g1_i1:179-562(+)